MYFGLAAALAAWYNQRKKEIVKYEKNEMLQIFIDSCFDFRRSICYIYNDYGKYKSHCKGNKYFANCKWNTFEN